MRLSLSNRRAFISLLLITIMPSSLLADDTGAAVLRSNGRVQVNKNAAPPSTTLFPDDLIETNKGSVARIEANGSVADINPETVVQFEGDELVLDHGSVSVNTSRGMKVRVGCILVEPANPDWTHYDVIDTDGKVTVLALKNDANINTRSANAHPANQAATSNKVTVREGEQKSREEKCGAAPPKEAETLAARGAWLNSPWAKGTGLALIGVLTCFALCHSDDPVSPSQP